MGGVPSSSSGSLSPAGAAGLQKDMSMALPLKGLPEGPGFAPVTDACCASPSRRSIGALLSTCEIMQNTNATLALWVRCSWIHVADYKDLLLMIHLDMLRGHSSSRHIHAGSTQSPLPTGASWKLRPKSLSGSLSKKKLSRLRLFLGGPRAPGLATECACMARLKRGSLPQVTDLISRGIRPDVPLAAGLCEPAAKINRSSGTSISTYQQSVPSEERRPAPHKGKRVWLHTKALPKSHPNV